MVVLPARPLAADLETLESGAHSWRWSSCCWGNENSLKEASLRRNPSLGLENLSVLPVVGSSLSALDMCQAGAVGG